MKTSEAIRELIPHLDQVEQEHIARAALQKEALMDYYTDAKKINNQLYDLKMQKVLLVE